MDATIPKGLRNTYLAQFIFTLVFGIAGTFAASFVGNLAGHPVHDGDVNMGLGVTTLALALGSWFAFKATRWEQISLFTAVCAFNGLVGGVLNLFAYFVPGFVNMSSLPPVQLLVAVIVLLLGISFTYYYFNTNKALNPIEVGS
jgi:hypothetical protein